MVWIRWATAGAIAGLLGITPGAAGADEIGCLKATGKSGSRCLERYLKPIEKCRAKQGPDCEAGLRTEGGALDEVVAAAEPTLRDRCDLQGALDLGFLQQDDVVLRSSETCRDFAEDFLAGAYVPDPTALADAERSCQRFVARQLGGLRKKTIAAYGKGCLLKRARGKVCDVAKLDQKLEKRRAKAEAKILAKCSLPGVTDDVAARTTEIVTRARHFAQRIYPPNTLGPAAEFGPFPVGVRTLLLEDAARMNVAGDAPRPVVTEVYYPSTDAAVAGLSGDVASVIGIPIVETPTFRDVAAAPGLFPIVLFSHGNGGIRFQSLYFAAHLASHGYVVVSPDHHGNSIPDAIAGVSDPDVVMNRPLDMSFLIDQLEGFQVEGGHFLEGALDLDAIGASGHSFGGFTVFALAGGAFSGGTFTEPRVDAILPLAPAAFGSTPAFFESISIPTLVIGGTLDETTPFDTNQQQPYDSLSSGAAVVGLATLRNAGHFTFSDFCEVPRDLLEFLGGFDEACEPRHLAWRYARDLFSLVGLHFFDAILKGDAAALAALDPAQLSELDDLTYESK